MDSKKLTNNSKKLIILISILSFVFITSLIFYFVDVKSTRKVFIFQSLDDNSIHFEVRYLPKVEKSQRIEQYINGLLLGPINDRYRPLFPDDTKLNYLYIGSKWGECKRQESDRIPNYVRLIIKNEKEHLFCVISKGGELWKMVQTTPW